MILIKEIRATHDKVRYLKMKIRSYDYKKYADKISRLRRELTGYMQHEFHVPHYWRA